MGRSAIRVDGVGGLLAVPLVAIGQPQGSTAGGDLADGPKRGRCRSSLARIVDRLCELGYVEGRNVTIDFWHAASEERFRELATQLVGLAAR